jgi:hypothetical protein
VSDREYDNELRGVLFKNEVKGQAYFLDAWIKESKKPGGKKFMSLRLKPKMAREHQGASDNPPAQYAGNKDPF